MYTDGPANGYADMNAGLKDGSGLMVDIDEFCDLLLECHYKTRTVTRAESGARTGGGGKKRGSIGKASPSRAKSPPPAATPVFKKQRANIF